MEAYIIAHLEADAGETRFYGAFQCRWMALQVVHAIIEKSGKHWFQRRGEPNQWWDDLDLIEIRKYPLIRQDDKFCSWMERFKASLTNGV